MADESLETPLLTSEDNDATAADRAQSEMRSGFINPDPSDSQLNYVRDSNLHQQEAAAASETKTQLEYEPSDYDEEDDSPPPVKTVRVEPQDRSTISTSSQAICITCPYCNTTADTTVVHCFGRCTCLWICVLLVLCFPIFWLPFFWKDCHDTKHYCTFCSKELGRSKAKCCQLKKMGEEVENTLEDTGKAIKETVKDLEGLTEVERDSEVEASR